jgi:hypothetical protein
MEKTVKEILRAFCVFCAVRSFSSIYSDTSADMDSTSRQRFDPAFGHPWFLFPLP